MKAFVLFLKLTSAWRSQREVFVDKSSFDCLILYPICGSFYSARVRCASKLYLTTVCPWDRNQGAVFDSAITPSFLSVWPIHHYSFTQETPTQNATWFLSTAVVFSLIICEEEREAVLDPQGSSQYLGKLDIQTAVRVQCDKCHDRQMNGLVLGGHEGKRALLNQSCGFTWSPYREDRRTKFCRICEISSHEKENCVMSSMLRSTKGLSKFRNCWAC